MPTVTTGNECASGIMRRAPLAYSQGLLLLLLLLHPNSSACVALTSSLSQSAPVTRVHPLPPATAFTRNLCHTSSAAHTDDGIRLSLCISGVRVSIPGSDYDQTGDHHQGNTRSFEGGNTVLDSRLPVALTGRATVELTIECQTRGCLPQVFPPSSLSLNRRSRDDA